MLACLALLLAGAAVLSCTFRDIEENVPMLNLWVYVEQPVLTKVYEGDIAAISAAETKINTLQIWVFRQSDKQLITYMTPPVGNLAGGSEERYSTPISPTFAAQAEAAAATGGLPVDVFVLANAASVGLNYDRNTTYTTLLNSAMISGEWFGTSSPMTASTIESAGLPMSCVSTTVKMAGSGLSFTIPTVTLTRAVSKLRFIMCQQMPGIDDFELTGLYLDSGMIPEQEYVFNDRPTGQEQEYRTGSTYVNSDTSFPVPANFELPKCLDYTAYLFDRTTMQAQQYENLINQHLTGNSPELAQIGPFYLRESGQKITGRITYNYTVENVQRNRTATFTLDATGDFARNHSWIIYAYFIGQRLVVQPTLIPWIAGNERLVHSTQGMTDLKYEKPWLRYDIDQNASTWNDTWLAVAYGYDYAKPKYSVKFTLETQSTFDMDLQLTNDKFIFVIFNQQSDGQGGYSYTYTPSGQVISIGASAERKSTSFYVVPVSSTPSADPYAKVVLIEKHEGDGLPPQAIPFNHNLPGDQDHTSILIYDAGGGAYQTALEDSSYDKTGNTTQNHKLWWEEKTL